jgi:hypothetical protein
MPPLTGNPRGPNRFGSTVTFDNKSAMTVPTRRKGARPKAISWVQTDISRASLDFKNPRELANWHARSGIYDLFC